MKLKRIYALALAAVMLLCAVPALAVDPVAPVAPGPAAVEVTMSDANSSIGAAYVLVTATNSSDEAISLTDVTCTSKRVIKDAVLLPNSNAPIEIAAGDSAQFMLSKGVATSVTGAVTETFDFTFSYTASDSTVHTFKKSASVALNFGEPVKQEAPAGESTPAFRLSAYDMDGKFVSTPSGNAGEKVTVKIPLQCINGPLDNVMVAPVLSTNLEEFPFDITQVDYTLAYDSQVKHGEIVVCEFTNLRLAKKATSGVKKVDFTVSYNSIWGDGTPQTMTVSIYVNVVKGYTETTGTDTPVTVSQPKLILESYSMSSDKIYAGEDFEVTFTLRNTSEAEAVKNIQISIADTLDTGKLLPAENGSNTLYISRIEKGEAYTVNYKMQSAADIEPKAYKLGLTLAYEGAKNVAPYTANETISVTILQKVRLKFDDPVFYDECYLGSTCAAYLAMYNMGRSSVFNCMLSVEGDGLELEETFFGGTVTAGGTLRADFNIITNAPGQIDGFIVFTYEDSLGEQMEERIPISLYVIDPNEGMEDPAMPGEVMPGEVMPGYEDPYMEAGGETGGGMPGWAWIAIGVGVLGCAAVVLIVVLKNKRNKQLEDV